MMSRWGWLLGIVLAAGLGCAGLGPRDWRHAELKPQSLALDARECEIYALDAARLASANFRRVQPDVFKREYAACLGRRGWRSARAVAAAPDMLTRDEGGAWVFQGFVLTPPQAAGEHRLASGVRGAVAFAELLFTSVQGCRIKVMFERDFSGGGFPPPPPRLPLGYVTYELIELANGLEARSHAAHTEAGWVAGMTAWASLPGNARVLILAETPLGPSEEPVPPGCRLSPDQARRIEAFTAQLLPWLEAQKKPRFLGLY